MPVDRSLLHYWTQQQAARTNARHQVPERWRKDPRPEMHAVTDSYIELFARTQLSSAASLEQDDR